MAEDREAHVRAAADEAVRNVHLSEDVPASLWVKAGVMDVYPVALAPLRVSMDGNPVDAAPARTGSVVEGKKVDAERELVTSQEFCPLDRTEEELVSLLVTMFEVLDLVRGSSSDGESEIVPPRQKEEESTADFIRSCPAKVDRTTLFAFLRAVGLRYREVPYHNFRHAVNVTQFVVYVLEKCGARKHFPPVEMLALMVASLCHDLDHPGLNNAFLVNAKSPLAAMYNDRAVLEQHHSAGTFRVLQRPDENILRDLPPKVYEHVRKTIVDCIMATDLADHGSYMATLKEITGRVQEDGDAWANDTKQRGTVLLCILKAADISNEIRPTEVGEAWAYLVVTEFFAQAQLESARGLPVAPHMDPVTNTVAKSQLGFIKFLCMPLFTELVKIITPLDAARKQMQINLERWESLT